MTFFTHSSSSFHDTVDKAQSLSSWCPEMKLIRFKLPMTATQTGLNKAEEQMRLPTLPGKAGGHLSEKGPELDICSASVSVSF